MTEPWNVIVPEAAAVTNLITNPSIEGAVTTGFTAVGSTLGYSSVQSRRGRFSLSVDPTTATGDGVYYTTSTLSSGVSYTFSLDIYGVDGIPYQIYFATTGAVRKSTATTFTGLGYWKRYSNTWTADADAAFRLYVVKNNSSNGAAFYCDGFQLVALDHDTSYIDGDQEDCYWTGTPHASTSVRKALSRAGGKAVSWDTYGMTIVDFVDAGMPPVETLAQPYALLPGTLDSGEKIAPRQLNFAMDCHATTAAGLLTYRGGFINAIKPDRTKDANVWLEYTGGKRRVRVRGRYAGGLNFPRGTVYTQRIGARFYCDDPFFYEDGEGSKTLTSQASVANADYVIRRTSGTWANISTDFAANVSALCLGQDGCIYIAGSFVNVGDANGDRIVKWNPATSTLASLGTGLNGAANALAVAANGDIYVGGAFTLAGGVADTVRVAYWDISAEAWVPLSTGIGGGTVMALCFDQAGNLYIGGTFTNHIDANGDYITKWDGTNFTSLSSSVLDGAVYAIACAPSGDMYIGGAFGAAGALTAANGIVKWDGSTWSALSTGIAGLSAFVTAVEIDTAGNVYLGGEFTTAGGVTCNSIAKWNGTNYEALGSGVSIPVGTVIDVNTMAIASDGNIFAGGTFSIAGGRTLTDCMAIWNGTTWQDFPCDLPGTTVVNDILFVGDDLYIGYSDAGTAAASSLNTVTNTGTAISYPVIYVSRLGGTEGTLKYIKNETTGATLYFSYALRDGETLTIDCRPGYRTITSNVAGNVVGRSLLSGSDFAGFYLLPGSNNISVFATKTGSTITSYMTWPITHHSIDGPNSDNADGAGGGVVA